MRTAALTAATGAGGVDTADIAAATGSLNVHGTVIAFDYGARRTGIAAGDTATATGGALATIATADTAAVDTIISEWRPAAIIVGIALSGDGDETALSTAARNFGAGLRERYGLRVFFVNEALSSIAADGIIGGGAKKTKDKQHAVAAALILESFFNSLAENKK